MRKVRLGFIGAGWWATSNHLPVLRKRADVDFVAVCSLGGQPALDTLQREWGFRLATEDVDRLLAQELDAVIISSPHRFHFEHARAALRHGLHVMCEKPMTLHAAEAWELVTLARSAGKQLLVPYGWHYKPFVQHAKQLVDEGRLGDVHYVLCHMASPARELFTGGTSGTTHPDATPARPDHATWQVRAYGGGYAHGQLTHAAALCFWLTSLRARSVTALTTAPGANVDLYNAAAVSFDGGAIGTFSGAATLPQHDPFQLDLRVFGTDGVLLLDVERERLELRRHDGKHIHVDVPNGDGAYSCDVPPERFIELVHGRGRNDSSGEIAARAVELIDALERSAAAGGVRHEIERSANTDDVPKRSASI